MKKTVFIFLLAIISLLACNKDEEEINDALISHSECKSFKDGGNDFSAIEYQYNADSKQLKFRHINSAFNCCPGELSVQISIEGNSIKISEAEKEAACNCLCLFDLEMQASDINAGIYQLKITEPYLYDQESLECTINLNDSITGTYRLERSNYPWGI